MPRVKAITNPDVELDIRPVAGRIGAEIADLKLTPDLDPFTVLAIRKALLKHKVLFFRNQLHIDELEQESFAELLGQPVAHPTVAPLSGTKYTLGVESAHGAETNSWHTDVTFALAYPQISILRAQTVPVVGGDTIWANTVAALDDLSPELRDLATRLWAVHTNDFIYGASQTDIPTDGLSRLKKAFAGLVHETEHPVVRVHPETGEHSLVLGHFVKNFVGLSPADSSHLFALLQDHVTRPENTVRWRWGIGDIAIWDNRATQHYSVADYGDRPRVLHRVSLKGDIPVSVDGHYSIAKKVPGVQAAEPISVAA
jgi:taurine dioxygenase